MGRRHRPPQHARAAPFCTAPGCSLPAVATGFQAGYADSWLNILGVLSQATQRANYDRDGTPQAPRSGRSRASIASDEYEFYVQDSWQLRPNLTLTAGLRYSLYSPPYEPNGLQVAPTISMGEWFDQRVRRNVAGHPLESQPDRHLRSRRARRTAARASTTWDKNNFAPRVARPGAWTVSDADRRRQDGHPRRLFEGVRPRRPSASRTNFDAGFAFGMSTSISSPFGLAYETEPGASASSTPRRCRPRCRHAPAGGFPQTPPQRAGIITTSIDDTLVTPSAHMAQRNRRASSSAAELRDRGRATSGASDATC